MTKEIISILCICCITVFSQSKYSGEYKIIRIDSIDYHYVINMLSIKDTTKKMIVVSSKSCNNKKDSIIKVNNTYFFDLHLTGMIRVGKALNDSLILNGRSFTINNVRISNNDFPFASQNLDGLSYRRLKHNFKDTVKCLEIENKSNKCISSNINEIVKVEKNILEVDSKQILLFLLTIKKECENNTEFSEYSNKVLFELLDKRTSSLIKVISKNSSLDIEYILLQISNPILDYDYKSLKTKIGKCKTKSVFKKKLIDAIDRINP